VLKVGHLDHPHDLWYTSEDGRPLEMRFEVQEGAESASPRFRPIAEAAIGKAPDRTLEVSRGGACWICSSRSGRTTRRRPLAACFDFDRIAKESIRTLRRRRRGPEEGRGSASAVLLKNMMLDEKDPGFRSRSLRRSRTRCRSSMKSTEENGLTIVVIKRGRHL